MFKYLFNVRMVGVGGRPVRLGFNSNFLPVVGPSDHFRGISCKFSVMFTVMTVDYPQMPCS